MFFVLRRRQTGEVMAGINKQSPDTTGVHVGKDVKDEGAGDQGIMFGKSVMIAGTGDQGIMFGKDVMNAAGDSDSGAGDKHKGSEVKPPLSPKPKATIMKLKAPSGAKPTAGAASSSSTLLAGAPAAPATIGYAGEEGCASASEMQPS